MHSKEGNIKRLRYRLLLLRDQVFKKTAFPVTSSIIQHFTRVNEFFLQTTTALKSCKHKRSRLFSVKTDAQCAKTECAKTQHSKT